MMLLLEGSQEGAAPKLWAKLYGGDRGWNVQPEAVLRILELDEDADEAWELWESIFNDGRYTNDQGVWRMHLDGDLYLTKV
jgi:hypothetical protein